MSLVILLTLACAVSEPPSGGPEDRDAPTVVATVPAADSVGVDPGSPIAVTFGEDMTRARVERLVSVQPPITIDHVKWEGRTLVIVPSGGLARDTTYVVRLKPGYRDRHGVAAAQAREFAFATGASLDTARITGVVRFKREPTAKGVVRAFRVPRDTTFRAEAARPDREAATGRDGTFALRYLPSNDARFVVMAFVDQNGNGTFEPAAEPFAVWGDTVVLTPKLPEFTGVQIAVIDPHEPAEVRGVVSNETGIDSVLATVGLFGAGESARAKHVTRCDTTGTFALTGVRPGGYRLWAFLDLRADSTCGDYECGAAAPCPEPCVALADSLVLAPGASVDVGRLVLRRREP